MENQTEKHQEILAQIKIARANLYVFRDSNEKDKWEQLLDEAERAVSKNSLTYADLLTKRVSEVIDALWKRIFRWQDVQRQVTTVFLIALPIELIAFGLYIHFINIVQFGIYTSMICGLLGGSLGVALNIGKDLKIDGSNRLQMLRIIMRPFIGVISAIVIFSLLQTKIISVSQNIDAGSLLILLSLFAGFSERFIVKAFSDYIPSIIR